MRRRLFWIHPIVNNATLFRQSVKNMQNILYDTLFALGGVENIKSGYMREEIMKNSFYYLESPRSRANQKYKIIFDILRARGEWIWELAARALRYTLL